MKYLYDFLLLTAVYYVTSSGMSDDCQSKVLYNKKINCDNNENIGCESNIDGCATDEKWKARGSVIYPLKSCSKEGCGDSAACQDCAELVTESLLVQAIGRNLPSEKFFLA